MGAVTDAVSAEIDTLHGDDTAPGLAQLALALARSIDDTDAATARAVAGRELRAVMTDLRKLAPVGEEGDAVDDIARQREKRRAAARDVADG
ncbi:hypothetical protein ACIPPM_22085 [Streptomyces sp. NPDC090119]|uniref:hypothetical protein n=1 Tax=Streptomyces sp. NPDC090119 TaxID=3365951 RepID=UPI003810C1D0